MHYQYAKFVTLTLPFYGFGRIPIYPFDTSNGISSEEYHGVFYHYHPAVTPVLFNNIGYAVSHYADNDSRFVCCLSCTDDVYGQSPDILVDAVEMGMSPFGAKLLTPEEALRLARYLNPSRQYAQKNFDIMAQTITKLITIHEITLNIDGILTREATTSEVLT